MSPVLLLAAQATVAAVMLLGLFRMRGIFGLAPLYAALGSFQILQTLSATIYVPLLGDLHVSPGSAVLYPATIASLLLVYLREGVLEARKLIYALVISNIVGGVLLLSLDGQLSSGAVSSYIEIPAGMLPTTAGTLSIGTILLFFVSLLMPVLYELLARVIKISWIKIFLTLAIVLSLDGIVFITWLLGFRPDYESLLFAAVVGKLIAAFTLATLLTAYLRGIEGSEQVTGAVRAMRDVFAIFSYRERYEELKLQVIRDSLTGLYNRSFFDESFAQHMANARRRNYKLSLMLIDLDFFKLVNDNYGHQKGDEALQLVGQLLREGTRQSDIAVRYGGEEFAVLLPETDLNHAMSLAETIRSTIALRSNEVLPGHGFTCTIGVSGYPDDGLTAADIFRIADRRLYSGKRNGRNRVVGESAAAPT